MTAQGDRERSAGGRPRTRVERAWIVIACVIGTALTLVVVASLMAPGKAHDIWVEIAKSSLYMVALAVTGGIVAIVVRDRDAAREEERRRVAYRLDFLEEVGAAFTQIKAARRLLRTIGFDAPRDLVLGPEQVSGFRTQMASLNDAELGLEMLARKVALMPERFGPRAATIERELREAYGYLRLVLFEFEADPTSVAEGGSTAELQRWPHFLAFIGYDEASVKAFNEGVADRMSMVEQLVLGRDEGAAGASAAG